MPFLILWLTVAAAPSFLLAAGQQDQADLPPATEQLEQLKERLSLANLEQTEKERIQSILSVTDANLSRIAEKQAFLNQLKSDIRTAEERATSFKNEFAKLSDQPPKQIANNIEDDRLAAEISKSRVDVENLRTKHESNELASEARIARQQEVRKKLESFAVQANEINKQLQAIQDAEDSLANEATLFKLQTDAALTELDKTMIQLQTQRDETEAQFDLLKNEHDLLEAQLGYSESQLKQLEELQRSRLERSVKKQFDVALNQEQQIKESIPLLLPSYEINTKLAKRAQEVEQQAATAKSEAEKLDSELAKLNEDFRETQTRVKAIGLTESLGALLRKQRKELIAQQTYNFASNKATQIDELQFELFDIENMREELSPKLIQSEIEALHGPQDQNTWEQLESPISEAIEARKTHLAAAKNGLGRLFKHLLDVQGLENSRSKTENRFRAYINERILWIRSNDILLSELSLDKSDKIAFDPERWLEAVKQTSSAMGISPIVRPAANANETEAPIHSPFSYLRLPLTVLGGLICFWLLLAKPRMRREVDAAGVVAARSYCSSFWPTTRAFVLTTLGGSAIPIIPILIGLAIKFAPFHGSVLFHATGEALITAGLFALPVEILRRMCRPQGLANEHFDWPDPSIATLKHNLNWVVLPGSLIIFAVTLLHNLDLSHRVDLLERIFFVSGMLLAAFFLYRTLNARTGIFNSHLAENERSWSRQTYPLWIGFILLIPISLAALAFWGYYFTALNLTECAYATLVFAMAIETFRGLAQRYVLVRRRDAFKQTARRKRLAELEARRLEREKEQAELEANQSIQATTTAQLQSTTPQTPPQETIDVLTEIQPEEIEESVQQAYKLISMSMLLVWLVGMWMIWTDVLPAIRALDSYTLWPHQVVVENLGQDSTVAETAATGNVATANIADANTESAFESTHRITVRDVLLFLVIAIVTWVAAMNLPNAFEIMFLEELPVDRSFRYAIKALTSYAIVMLGVALAFRTLSIGWANVQWLATALTFGLAFGLQEIFANFVAGIILMFERPMRIGDLVTVDQFTGVVTRIRTRATTIVNWDRKEYVIPNKDFITGRLVNWTLSDAINRIELDVGIAYDSDVELAKNTLYEVCNNHPKVVQEPATRVIFNKFGDSTLNLHLRCFIGDVDSRQQVTDSLHTLINQAFRDANIEISFPQRDLHIKSIDAGVSEIIKSN